MECPGVAMDITLDSFRQELCCFEPVMYPKSPL
uniref:Uncharacterized protein n=1 Tax=Anguilla anguilla TaxID=7936 RepID=A0A0E9V1U5_ANGAN